MNRDIRRLRRHLEKGPDKGCSPFNSYSYNVFGWQAQYWTTHGKTEEERQEAERLRKLAIEKANSFQ